MHFCAISFALCSPIIALLSLLISSPAHADACADYNNWKMMGLSGTIGEQLRAKCAGQSQVGGEKAKQKACSDYANARMMGMAGGSIGETLRVKCYGY